MAEESAESRQEPIEEELTPEERALIEVRKRMQREFEDIFSKKDRAGRIISDHEKGVHLFRLLAQAQAAIDDADTGVLGEKIDPVLLERERLIRNRIAELTQGPKSPRTTPSSAKGVARVQPPERDVPPTPPPSAGPPKK
jgi:hypothetical protein